VFIIIIIIIIARYYCISLNHLKPNGYCMYH